VVSQNHIAEDVLESYVMVRLSDAEIAAVEEHLLICQACRERLERLDDFVGSIRSAAAATAGEAGCGPKD
jgi:anti-sigma factor RsiW